MQNPDRRRFVQTATLSAAAFSLLSGRGSFAGSPHDAQRDVSILNVALGLEHQGIGAYTLGAQSGLLAKPTLALAVKFQDDHKVHRDLLAQAITKLGGSPVAEKALTDYAQALHADKLKSETDVLTLAASLELGATNAYLSVIPSFQDRELAKVAARIGADETAHWALLNQALGKPLPKAMGFGG